MLSKKSSGNSFKMKLEEREFSWKRGGSTKRILELLKRKPSSSYKSVYEDRCKYCYTVKFCLHDFHVKFHAHLIWVSFHVPVIYMKFLMLILSEIHVNKLWLCIYKHQILYKSLTLIQFVLCIIFCQSLHKFMMYAVHWPVVIGHWPFMYVQ